MTYLVTKALISAAIIVITSEIAKRSTAFGALVAALPLVSVLAIIWLWRDTGDAERIADFTQTTLWYVLPSLPMYLLVPAMLRHGWGFWPALAAGIGLTVVLYVITAALLARAGIRL
jgi:hypothetical protein